LIAIAISTGQSGLDHSAPEQGQIMSSAVVVEFLLPVAGIQKPESSIVLRQQSPYSGCPLWYELGQLNSLQIGQVGGVPQKVFDHEAANFS